MGAKAKIYAILSKPIPVSKWVKKLATAVATCFKWISGGTKRKIAIAAILGVFLSVSAVFCFHIYCPNETCENMICKLVWKHSPWLLFTGLAAAPSMLLTWFWRRQQNVERLITERFAKATEQLGSDQMAVRLGAIYQLERIAQDSKRDHWTVVETLSAYIRENAKQNDDLVPPTTDIQAALTVLCRRKWRNTEKNGIDLSNTNLQKADLSNAHLERANLWNARLEEADLGEAHLERANLGKAHLERAFLGKAHLEGAKLWDAQLEDALLGKAHLEGADL